MILGSKMLALNSYKVNNSTSEDISVKNYKMKSDSNPKRDKSFFKKNYLRVLSVSSPAVSGTSGEFMYKSK